MSDHPNNASKRVRRPCFVYLLCLASSFSHAKHYLGSSIDVERRLAEHRRGQGSKFTRAVIAAGIELHLARVWDSERYDEVLKKSHKNFARLCPNCRKDFLRRARARRKAKRAAQRALKETVELAVAA